MKYLMAYKDAFHPYEPILGLYNVTPFNNNLMFI